MTRLLSPLVGLLLLACGGQEDPPAEPSCLSELELECAVTYEPTFEAIFANRMQETCGAGGRTCHSSTGAQSGLVMDDIDLAYDGLLGLNGGTARVVPGDPECSEMIRRIESNDEDYQMPPGEKLSAGERCAIRKWKSRRSPRGRRSRGRSVRCIHRWPGGWICRSRICRSTPWLTGRMQCSVACRTGPARPPWRSSCRAVKR